MNKVEILAPAGDMERLKTAIRYGADAVYIGGQKYGLRANANNFSIEEIKEATEFVHSHNKKIYVTVNMFFHNEDLKNIDEYLIELDKIGIDAYIVSDYAIISRIKKLKLHPSIHISTQQSVTNYETVKIFKKLGIKRVILARECSKEDIIDIKNKVDAELEIFIHGSMCTSYSGKCVMSNYVTLRDANRGGCAQVCRFNFDIGKDKDFTICSKDLNMVEYIEDMINIGITSLKIEGRMRSIYYIATVVNAYRNIVDAVYNKKLNSKMLNYYKKILDGCANRESIPQFYNKRPGVHEQYYAETPEISNQDFLGYVLNYDSKTKMMEIEQRNNFKIGNEVIIFGPNTKPFKFKIQKIIDKNGLIINCVPHPQQVVYVKVPHKVERHDIMRKPV